MNKELFPPLPFAPKQIISFSEKLQNEKTTSNFSARFLRLPLFLGNQMVVAVTKSSPSLRQGCRGLS